MDLETSHYWLLLRPLIVFVLACPLLIVAALIDRYKQRRDAKRLLEAEASCKPMTYRIA